MYRRFVEEGVDSTTEIAKLTGYDMTKVSRLKTQIATKISKYLEGVDTSGMKN